MSKQVKVGQICWLSGGFTDGFSGRLVKVVKIGNKRKYSDIDVFLLNKKETDCYYTKDGMISVFSSDYLLTSPEDFCDFCEGSREDVLLTLQKQTLVCGDCATNLTSKAKFCWECGTPYSTNRSDK